MEQKLKDIFDNVNEWLKFAEGKNAALAASNFALAFAVLSIGKDIARPNWILECIYYFDILLYIVGGAISLLSFAPQVRIGSIRQEGVRLDRDNLIFYGDIAKYSVEEYLSALSRTLGKNDTDASGIERAYAEQVVINSRIALRKFKTFSIALRITFLALLLPLLGFIGLLG